MSQVQQAARGGVQLALQRFCIPMSTSPMSARWRINGYPARLLIWTIEEWERLDERPVDAQFHPIGVWCALRVD